MTRTLMIAAGLASLTIAAQPAFAQQTRTVSYADLDLASTAGQAALDARLRGAARAVCDVGTDRVSLQQGIAASHCYRSALETARTRYAAARSANQASR